MKASQFLLTIFFVAATVTVAFAKRPAAQVNARIIATSYFDKVKGKGGQLDTDLRSHIFDGLGLNKSASFGQWKHIKHDIGNIIWKVNHNELKALPGLIVPNIKGSLKGNTAALNAVIHASTSAIIKDFQSKAPALLAGLLKTVPTKIAHSLNPKNPSHNVITKVENNIKAAVNLWKTKQLITFAEHFGAANFPANLFKQLV